MKNETIAVEIRISKRTWAWIFVKSLMKVFYYFVKEKVFRIKPKAQWQ